MYIYIHTHTIYTYICLYIYIYIYLYIYVDTYTYNRFVETKLYKPGQIDPQNIWYRIKNNSVIDPPRFDPSMVALIVPAEQLWVQDPRWPRAAPLSCLISWICTGPARLVIWSFLAVRGAAAKRFPGPQLTAREPAPEFLAQNQWICRRDMGTVWNQA